MRPLSTDIEETLGTGLQTPSRLVSVIRDAAHTNQRGCLYRADAL
jgi:hypothetical protein